MKEERFIKLDESSDDKNDSDNDNENKSNSSNDEYSDPDDLTYGQPTLIDMLNKQAKKSDKSESSNSFLKNKRKNQEQHIIYDSTSKKILNSFCPSFEDLQEFLEKCEVREIDIDNYDDEESFNIEGVFDPREFMQKNHIAKSYLSLEDLQYESDESDENDDDKIQTLIKPKMVNDFSSSFPMSSNLSQFQSNEINKSNSSEKIANILKNNLLNSYEKNWLNNHIKKIWKMPLETILMKGKKLEIIFDLDHTLIFSFINTYDKEAAKSFLEKYPEKNVHMLSFSYQKKCIYSSYIIRKGIKEFINYTKEFCNFHVRTLAKCPYAKKIIKNLEKNFNVKFDRIIGRDSRKKYKDPLSKFIREFKCDYINNNNTIIFDDSVGVWKDDLVNVIPSKKFFDKEYGVNLLDDNKGVDSNFNYVLSSHGKFYYHSFAKDNSSWRNQNLKKSLTGPFFQYKEQHGKLFFDVYHGEYLDCDKKQFIYLENVVKAIYFMVNRDKVPIYDAIKLIRLNALYGKYFYLKFIDYNEKNILSDIIKVCGGEIIETDDSINCKMKNIYLVCSMNNYEKERRNIRNERKINPNYILVNEKFILDSYYFMTGLEVDNLINIEYSEYSPEYCYKLGNEFFK